MKNQNFDPKQFLDATELSPIDNATVRGGEADKKKKKEKKVVVGEAEQ